jgi:hypothetical protein
MTDFDLNHLGEIPDPYAPPAADVAARAPDVASLPPSRTRANVRSARAAAILSALLFNGAWIAFIERRRDLGSLAPQTLAVGLGIPMIAAVVALVAVVRPGARGLGGRVAELAALVCVPPLLFAIGTLATASPAAAAGPFVGPALRCIGAAAVLAVAPFVVALLAMRRSFVSSAAWRTAALGVACGGLAAATMSVACPNGEPMHVLVAHGATMLFVGLAGAFAGARLTRA